MDKEHDKVVVDEDGVVINDNDIKIDTTPASNEEAEIQEKVKETMNEGKEVKDDDISETKEDDKDDEEDKKEILDEEEKDDKKEPDKKEEDEKGKFGGFDTFEEYQEHINSKLTESQSEAVKLFKENQALKTGTDPSKIKTDDTNQFNQQQMQKDFVDFCNKNKDILGESAAEDYKKFLTSGNNFFIHNNPKLSRIDQALQSISENLPFKERVNSAFKIAFSDEIIEQRSKQAKVKAEITHQENNKKAETGGGQGDGGNNSSYTPEQLAIAEKMGVELE